MSEKNVEREEREVKVSNGDVQVGGHQLTMHGNLHPSRASRAVEL